MASPDTSAGRTSGTSHDAAKASGVVTAGKPETSPASGPFSLYRSSTTVRGMRPLTSGSCWPCARTTTIASQAEETPPTTHSSSGRPATIADALSVPKRVLLPPATMRPVTGSCVLNRSPSGRAPPKIACMDLFEAFELEPGAVVAAVGGGGKTSVVYALGDQAAAMGLSAIVASTTKFTRRPAGGPMPPVVEASDADSLELFRSAIGPGRAVAGSAGAAAKGRMQGYAPE